MSKILFSHKELKQLMKESPIIKGMIEDRVEYLKKRFPKRKGFELTFVTGEEKKK